MNCFTRQKGGQTQKESQENAETKEKASKI